MRIAKKILGVKGLKAYKQLIAAKTTYWMTPKYLRFQFLFENDLTTYWFRNFKNRFAPPQPHTNYFKRCFRYSSARVWYSQSHDLCSAVSLGPWCTAQILVYFAKISVINSVTGVLSEFFLPYFSAIIPPWSRTNLCHV